MMRDVDRPEKPLLLSWTIPSDEIPWTREALEEYLDCLGVEPRHLREACMREFWPSRANNAMDLDHVVDFALSAKGQKAKDLIDFAVRLAQHEESTLRAVREYAMFLAYGDPDNIRRALDYDIDRISEKMNKKAFNFLWAKTRCGVPATAIDRKDGVFEWLASSTSPAVWKQVLESAWKE